MDKNDLEKYANSFSKEKYEPYIFKIVDSIDFQNAPNTSNHHALRGISWIDYWRALTKTYDNHLHCACCGRDIFVDTKENDCWECLQKCNPSTENVTLESYQAEGGHVIINWSSEIYNGYYIVPLCRKCNNSQNTKLRLMAGTKLCAEIAETMS